MLRINPMPFKQSPRPRVCPIVYLGVNFLGHYLLDFEENNALYNAGLLAPDLIRNATRGRFKPAWNLESNPLDWHRGALQHMQRDAWFHQHEFFENVYQHSRDWVRESFLQAQIPRFYFGLHVGIEMALDKALIFEHPGAPARMYQDLEKAFPSIEQWLTEHRQDQAIAGVQRFIESRYIERHQEDQDLAYGLMRVYLQTGAIQTEWNQDQLQAVAQCFQHWVARCQEHLHLLKP